jgi:hypothetical protein
MQRVETEGELQHQGQQECTGADAETKEQAAEDTRFKGLQRQQAKIEQRVRRLECMPHIEGE